MRQIKFRGRVIKRKATVNYEANIGDLVTGSLIICEDEFAGHYWIRRQQKEGFSIDYPVDPKSVAQFVGYDCYGREVYEGDKLINDRDCTIFTAGMNHIYTVKQYRLLEAAA